MELTYSHESFSPWKLMDETLVDERVNKANYSLSAIAGMFGLMICTLIPLPVQEKEQKITEWLRRKRDEEDENERGQWITKDGMRYRLRGMAVVNNEIVSVRDTSELALRN